MGQIKHYIKIVFELNLIPKHCSAFTIFWKFTYFWSYVLSFFIWNFTSTIWTYLLVAI